MKFSKNFIKKIKYLVGATFLKREFVLKEILASLHNCFNQPSIDFCP